MAPEVWSEQGAAVAADVEALAQWWETFGDPVLTSLVRRAIKGNLDVRTSLSRLREARASVSSARASLNPVVDASGTMVATGRRDEVLGSVTTRSYSVGFDASWELDVFGGIRSTIDAAAATAEARAADLQDVLISLTAEVAIDYVDVRTLQRRLEIALANANVQEQTLELAQFRAQAGLATDLDVQQALSNLESTRAQISSLDAQTAQAIHRVAVLIGQAPAALDAPLPGAWVGAGNGFALDPDLGARLGLVSVDATARATARAVGDLALPRLVAGEGVDAAAALPVYVRHRVALTTAERAAGARL